MWWRRSPSYWSRSLLPRRILRESDTLLRNTESTLRNRPFSKSQPAATQQQQSKDERDEEGKESSFLHYRRWKKEMERRILEDPYRMLFGASEQRLKGLGFGKGWMEVGMGWVEKEAVQKGWGKDASSKDATQAKPNHDAYQKPSPSEPGNGYGAYPRKVNISSDEGFKTHDTSARAFKLGRSESSAGVASPSDPRRPRERQEPVSENRNEMRQTGTYGKIGDRWLTKKEFHERLSQMTFEEFVDWEKENGDNPGQTIREKNREAMRNEATTREGDFISEFLNNPATEKPSKAEGSSTSSSQNLIHNNEWNHTVLDGQVTPASASNTIVAKASETELNKQNGVTRSDMTDSQAPIPGARFWPAMSNQNKLAEDTISRIPTFQSMGQNDRKIQPKDAKTEKMGINDSSLPGLTRSTSGILNKLPKDDIDFLSAADIRAAMGARKNVVEETSRSRAELEKDFNNAHEHVPELDHMIEAKIVNDKHIRRTEREIKAQQEAEAAGAESLRETSVGRFSKMLHDSGDMLTRYLWSDPASVDGTQTPAKPPQSVMLGSIIYNLRQNRNTMKQISQNLENDIPTTKDLLKALKDFESRAIGSVLSLSRYRGNTQTDATIEAQKKEEVTRSFRLVNYHSVMVKQIEEAYKAIDSMSNLKLSETIQERLRAAAEALQENARSTRKMWRSLTTPMARRAGLDGTEPLHGMLVYHLRAMYDLQNSLLKVVERVMLRFGVAPWPESERETKCEHSTDTAPTENRAKSAELTRFETTKKMSAANQKLEKEIQAQKCDMHGLSDDGYTPVTQSVSTKTLDEPSPLTNSHFRPFGLRLGSFGSGEGTVKEEFSKDIDIEAMKRREKEKKDEEFGKDTTPPSTNHNMAPSPHVSLRPTSTLPLVSTPSAESPQPNIKTALPNAAADDIPPPELTIHKILTYNALTDELSITTTTAVSQTNKPTVPLADALATLDHPSVFLPYLIPGFDVLTAKNNMLVLRENDGGPHIQTETIKSNNGQGNKAQEQADEVPVDPITPNGPHGKYPVIDAKGNLKWDHHYDPNNTVSQSQVKELMQKHEIKEMKTEIAKLKKRSKGGVLRTVVIAGAGCYALGVLSELIR